MRYQDHKFLARFREVLTGPQALAFLPALCLSAYWFGGETVFIVTTLMLPAMISALNLSRLHYLSRLHSKTDEEPPIDGLTGFILRPSLVETLDRVLETRDTTGRVTSCLVLELDDYSAVTATFGGTASEALIKAAARRLRTALREDDTIARLENARFAIALSPMRQADLESLIQLSSRIQAALSDPFSINASKVYLSCSVGFCLPLHLPKDTGETFLEAAEMALMEARHNGPGSIRSYAPARPKKAVQTGELLTELPAALENGEIRPWYQPQISTDTGKVSGVEALARWHHPQKGNIAPGYFMEMVEELGLIERLSETILYHALSTLKTWDDSGVHIPSVSVNLTSTDLANPKLIDKIRWDLDRFDLPPSRLTIEILESVISHSGNDIITRNIWALKELGCGVELDDYGTGHASLPNIRRFSVDRIKIDRSYVTRCDIDRDQQNMLAAILTMAERLGLGTLAEGVETVGEHAMLAQLGCQHVQGYSISKPMTGDNAFEWIKAHNRHLSQTPEIGKRAG